MPLVFRCSQCGKTHARDESWAGKVINCEGCAKGMRIPAPQSTAAVAPGPRPELARSPEPVAGSAGSYPRMRPARDEAAGKPAGKGAEKQRSVIGNVISGVVAFLVVAGVVSRYVIRPYLFYQRTQQNQPPPNIMPPPGVDVGPAVPPAATPTPVASPARSGWKMPELPELADGTLIEPGVRFYEVRLPGNPPGQPPMPGHAGKLWLYLPEGDHDPKSLPCVLIAGAGSNLITGMELSDGDRPEHLPYAHAGMAVLAYELDGMNKEKKRSYPTLARCSQAFLAAEAGLVNMRVAVEFATTRVPSINPERLYAAGHSSAGTLALLVAENEPRIAACVAYAPVIDLGEAMNLQAQQFLAGLVPGSKDFFTRFNPHEGESNLNGPLYLFVALDDTNAKQVREAAQRLRGIGKNVTLGTVKTGGHHEPMIKTGIPAAIAWLKSLQPGPGGTLVPTKSASKAPPRSNTRRTPGKAGTPAPGPRRPRTNPGPR